MHLHAFHSGGFVHALKRIVPVLTLRQTLTDGRERVPQAGRSRILRSASYRCLSDPDANSLSRYFQKAENFDTHRVNVAKKDFEGRGQHGPVPLGQTATVAVSVAARCLVSLHTNFVLDGTRFGGRCSQDAKHSTYRVSHSPP